MIKKVSKIIRKILFCGSRQDFVLERLKSIISDDEENIRKIKKNCLRLTSIFQHIFIVEIALADFIFYFLNIPKNARNFHENINSYDSAGFYTNLWEGILDFLVFFRLIWTAELRRHVYQNQIQPLKHNFSKRQQQNQLEKMRTVIEKVPYGFPFVIYS